MYNYFKKISKNHMLLIFYMNIFIPMPPTNFKIESKAKIFISKHKYLCTPSVLDIPKELFAKAFGSQPANMWRNRIAVQTKHVTYISHHTWYHCNNYYVIFTFTYEISLKVNILFLIRVHCCHCLYCIWMSMPFKALH